MALIAVLSHDFRLRASVRHSLECRHSVAVTASWERLLHLVRERPVTAVVLDQGAFRAAHGPEGTVAALRARFPSLATVLVARPDTDPNTLLRLGRRGLSALVLVRVDDLGRELPRAVGRALNHGTDALVTRRLSPSLAGREVRAVRGVLEGALRGWGAEEVAGRLGLTRPHLSVVLKAAGFPSLGHFLLWGKLLHAGRWLEDSGRSAQSTPTPRRPGYGKPGGCPSFWTGS